MCIFEDIVKSFIDIDFTQRSINIFKPWFYELVIRYWIDDKYEYEQIKSYKLVNEDIERIDKKSLRVCIMSNIKPKDIVDCVFYDEKVKKYFHEILNTSSSFKNNIFDLACERTNTEKLKVPESEDYIKFGRIINAYLS